MHSSDSDPFREEVSEIPRADQSDLGSSKPSRAYVHARLICPGCHCTKSERSNCTQQTPGTVSRYSLGCQVATAYTPTAEMRAMAARSGSSSWCV